MANEVKLEVACKTILGITSRRYRQLAKEGIVPEPVKGEIDILRACKAIIEYYRKLAQGQGSLTLTDERARLTKLRADQQELKLKKERGELIQVDLAMSLWGSVCMNIRNKLLAMPTKLAPLVFACKKISEVKEVIEKNIQEVLEEVANPNLKEITGMAGHKPGPANAKATTKANSKPVGGRKKGSKSRK